MLKEALSLFTEMSKYSIVKEKTHISREKKANGNMFYFVEKQPKKNRTARNFPAFCGEISSHFSAKKIIVA